MDNPIIVNGRPFIKIDGIWYLLYQVGKDPELLEGLDRIKKVNEDLQPVFNTIKDANS